MPVGCAILAAGIGSRFDRTRSKLSVHVRGRPLLQYAIDAACASPAQTCTLVLGANAEAVLAAVDSGRCAIAINDRWAEGIAASIHCAIEINADADSCILMLGDQPNVQSVDLAKLIVESAAAPRDIIALRSGRIWGAPALFPQRDFAALLRLTGDRGAKRYAREQERRVVFVEASRSDAFADVDNRADLKSLAAVRTSENPRSRSRA